MSKLGLKQAWIDQARSSPHHVAKDVQAFIDEHTTVTVERTICRLLGIDGVNEVDIPLPNVVVDHLSENDALSGGAAYYIGNAMAEYHLTPQEIAEKIDAGELNLVKVPGHSDEEIKEQILPIAKAMTERIAANAAKRREFLDEYGD